MSRYTQWALISILLLIILALSVVFSLSVGELNIGFGKAAKLIFSSNTDGNIEAMLIKQVRLPRILLGIAIGGSLSLAGVILQGIYRNPLVEPFTLGISGGASLGVAITIAFNLHSLGTFSLPFAGFVGAFITVFIVYTLSAKQGKVDIQRMLLVGVMVSFVASSALMLIMSITTSENLQSIIFWTMGSLDSSNENLIWITLGLSILCLILSYVFVQPLNALRLGEEKAKHLGINTDTAVKLLFLMTSILTGICVAVAGIIGFVGLIIPHLVRALLGSDYRILLLNSFVLGSSFVVFSDVLARRIIAPNELPIGVITGIIGGIAFIFIMTKKK